MLMELLKLLMEYLKQWSQKHDWSKYETYPMKAYITRVYHQRLERNGICAARISVQKIDKNSY